jgi:hypothetical protein
VIALILLIRPSIVKSQEKQTGHFVSNFVIDDLYSIQIQLYDDLTFNYQLKGHGWNDLSHGIYELNKDTIKLNFFDMDTLKHVRDSFSIFQSQLIYYKAARPIKLLYNKNRLILIYRDGKVEKKMSIREGKFKRFLFFGPKNFKKREWFLKRVQYEWKDW